MSRLISRRDFAATAIAGMSLLAFSPSTALAQVAGSSKNVDELWAEAVAEAVANGEPVIEDVVSCGGVMAARATNTVTGKNSKMINIGAIPDSIKAIAVYTVSNNKINSVRDAWVAGTQSTCTHCTYSYTIIDGGRTLAVKFTVTMMNYARISQSLKIYSEYGRTDGNGTMTYQYI